MENLFERFKSMIPQVKKEIDTCYGYACPEQSTVAVRRKLIGDIHFYCNDCAASMIKVMPNMYEIMPQGGRGN